MAALPRFQSLPSDKELGHTEAVNHTIQQTSTTLGLRQTTKKLIHRTTSTRSDWINPVCMALLAITGVFFIYSAQRFVGGNLWIKQIAWLILSLGVYWVVSRIDYQAVWRTGHWIYLLTLIPLLMLLLSQFGLPLLGVEREGAWRWLSFAGFTFQPSEGAKVGTLILCAAILSRNEVSTVGQSLRPLGLIFLTVLLPIVLILAQPDLGSAIIFPPMVFAMLYISNLSLRFFMVLMGGFFLLLAVVGVDLSRYYAYYQENDLDFYQNRGAYEAQSWVPLKDYQRIRLMTFIAPEAIDPRGIGDSWNMRQSLQAVGTGGMTGKGWTEGTQAQLGYLPRSVAHNDFIFAVLAEEKGFLGGMFVMALYALLIANTFRIAGASRDRFGLLIGVGVGTIFLVHVVINIGMNIGLMPITGLPLPFLSYGGSFILSSCILQGLVQSVYRYRRAFA